MAGSLPDSGAGVSRVRREPRSLQLGVKLTGREVESGGFGDRATAVAGTEWAGRPAAEEDVLEGGDDPLRGVTVPVGVFGARHFRVSALVAEQALAFVEDQIGVGADQPQRAGLQALRPLLSLAGDQ